MVQAERLKTRKSGIENLNRCQVSKALHLKAVVRSQQRTPNNATASRCEALTSEKGAFHSLTKKTSAQNQLHGVFIISTGKTKGKNRSKPWTRVNNCTARRFRKNQAAAFAAR